MGKIISSVWNLASRVRRYPVQSPAYMLDWIEGVALLFFCASMVFLIMKIIGGGGMIMDHILGAS